MEYKAGSIDTKYYILLIGAMIFLVGGFQNFLISFMPESGFPHFLRVDRKWYLFYWLLILFLMFSNCEKTEKFLGRKRICKNINHSFYVYILHFIVLKSIVMVVFSAMVDKIGFVSSVAFSTIFCIFATMVFAFLFDKCYKCLLSLLSF